MTRPFFNLTAEESVGTLFSDAANGLDDKAAAARLRKYGKNRIWYIPKESVISTAAKIILDPATLLLILIALIAAIFRLQEHILALCAVICASAILRIAAYMIARRIFEDKAKYALPHARVLRGGKLKLLPAEAIVEGDIVLFSPGDTVIADCRMISSGTLIVSEKNITENELPIEKTPKTLSLPDSCAVEIQRNMLFAGSTVLIGSTRAIVTGTADNAYISVRHGGIAVPIDEKMPVISKIDKWCRLCSLTMLAAAAFLTVLGIFFGDGNTLINVFISAMSLAAASMSEFLHAIALIVIACSMSRSEAGGAIIKNPASVDRISRCDCVLINSTTVLKSGKVSLHSCFVNGRSVNAAELEKDRALSERANELLYLSYLACGSTPNQLSAESDTESDDTSYIIRNILAKRGLSEKLPKFTVADHISKISNISGGVDTALVFDGEQFHAVVIGEAESVFAMCSTYSFDGGQAPTDCELRNSLAAELASLRRNGATVIAIAKRPSPYSTLNRVGALHMNMCFMGYIAISEAPAVGSAEAIAKLREAGIGVVLITDGQDNDITLAAELGIYKKNDAIVTRKMSAAAYRLPYKKGDCAVIFAPSAQNGGENIRKGIIEDIRNAGCKVLLCGAALSDRALIEEADACAIVLQKNDRSELAQIISAANAAPYALRDSADVFIMTEEARGGLGELAACRAECGGVRLKLKKCAELLITSQLARMLLVLIGLFPSMYLLPPHALLIWGTILDFLALLAAAFMPPPKDILKLAKAESALPSTKSPPFASVIMGIAWAILLALAPSIALLLEKAVPVGAMSALIFASASLSITVVAASTLTEGSLFARGTRISNSAAVFCLTALGIAVLVMLSPTFAESLCMNQPPLIYAVIPPFISAIMLAVYEIYKKIK